MPAFDADQRHVAYLVAALDHAGKGGSVVQHHPDPFGIADHVVVGQHQPVAADQHAGAVPAAARDQHGGAGDAAPHGPGSAW